MRLTRRQIWARIVSFGLLTPVCFLLWFGAKALREARAYPNPTTVSYAPFIANPPSHGWYRITGCHLDLDQAIEDTQNNIPVRVYAPVFDSRHPQAKTHVFAEIDDRKTLALFLDRYEMRRYHTPAEQAAWMQQHGAEFQITRDVAGLVSRGIYRPTENINQAFGAVADTDSDGFIIIADGWNPNPSLGNVLLGIGGVGALIVLVCARAGWRRG